MENYIDGFVFPVSRIHLSEYRIVAEKVAEIWKEYGAIAYFEYVGEDLKLEGTRSFVELVDLKEDEVIIFGWVIFPSKEIRERANKQVPIRGLAVSFPVNCPVYGEAYKWIYRGKPLHPFHSKNDPCNIPIFFQLNLFAFGKKIQLKGKAFSSLPYYPTG